MVHGAIIILLNMLASQCGMMYSTNVNTMDVVQMNTLCNVNILNSIISGTHCLYSLLSMIWHHYDYITLTFCSLSQFSL